MCLLYISLFLIDIEGSGSKYFHNNRNVFLLILSGHYYIPRLRNRSAWSTLGMRVEVLPLSVVIILFLKIFFHTNINVLIRVI